GLGCAVLTAIGRHAAYGVDHAFVTRYVSFSSLFWLGWFGLMALSLPTLAGRCARAMRVCVGVVAALALFNALHLVKQARDVAQRSAAIAEAIRADYPHPDEALLREIYFDQPEHAR